MWLCGSRSFAVRPWRPPSLFSTRPLSLIRPPRLMGFKFSCAQSDGYPEPLLSRVNKLAARKHVSQRDGAANREKSQIQEGWWHQRRLTTTTPEPTRPKLSFSLQETDETTFVNKLCRQEQNVTDQSTIKSCKSRDRTACHVVLLIFISVVQHCTSKKLGAPSWPLYPAQSVDVLLVSASAPPASMCV